MTSAIAHATVASLSSSRTAQRSRSSRAISRTVQHPSWKQLSARLLRRLPERELEQMRYRAIRPALVAAVGSIDHER